MWKRVKQKLYVLPQWVLLGFIPTFMLLALYAVLMPLPDTPVAVLYALSIPAYYYLLVFLVTVAVWPLVFVPVLHYLLVLPKTVLDVFLLFNFFVFKTYKFHIDSLFLNMLIHDRQGMGISLSLLLLAVLLVAAILWLNLKIFRYVLKRRVPHMVTGTVLMLVLCMGNQLAQVWGAYFKQSQITQFSPYFPGFITSTASAYMNTLSRDYPWIIPQQVGADPLLLESPTESLFAYPLKPLVFADTPTKRPNILLLVVESWRSDMLSPDVTPNLSAFAQKNTQFSQHYSSGNVTVSGMFGLLSGIDATNLRFAQSNPDKYASVFSHSLAKLGYSQEIYASSNLNRFALRDVLFGAVADEDYHLYLDVPTITGDQQISRDVVQSLRHGDQPWFKLVFLTSSHHNYYYPPEFQKHQPVPLHSEGFLFNAQTDRQPYVNDYKNSLLYVDSLFQQIYQAVDALGDNTLIVVTGDHGEEFNDNKAGFWGHGSNFTRYQTQVPLLIRWPGNRPAEEISQRSSHVDVVPTLLRYLGVKNDFADFSSGMDLRHLPDNRSLIFASYKSKAYLIDEMIYDIGTLTDSYRLDAVTEKNTAYRVDAVQALRVQERHFLRDNF